MKKYLHILNQTSPFFTNQLIYLINNELNLREYNTFVTFEKHILELNKIEKNIQFSDNFVDLINSKYDEYDYIFIHAMNFNINELLKIKREAKKKFIWLTWGHDLYGYDKNIVIRVLKQVKLRIRTLLLRSIYGVGYGFEFDEKQIHKLLPKRVNAFYIPYGYEKDYDEQYSKYFYETHSNAETNILIGHCGCEFINHIKIMKKLKQYNKESIRINLVISYGGGYNYLKKVKSYAYNNFDKNKVNIIEQRMNSKDYFEFLSSVDIAIFDYKHSSALSNIYKLLYLGKKLYLNDRGILYKGTSLYGNIAVFRTKDIGAPYKEFCRLLPNDERKKCHEYAKKHISDKAILKLWKDFFDNN